MTSATAPTAPPPATDAGTIDRFLAAIRSGRGADVGPLYAPDATLDATMPGWRYQRTGRGPIVEHSTGWFADAGRFEELDRRPTDDGEVVTYLLAWEAGGAPMAVHHCHVLTVDPASGLITGEQVFCGGRWDAATLAEIQAADDAR